MQVFLLNQDEIEAVVGPAARTSPEVYQNLAREALRKAAEELFSPCPLHFRNGLNRIECRDCLEQFKLEAGLE
ncbi:MAG: hypothetical protein R6U37_01100 [Dehalococcoidia bacterium]